MELRVMRGRAVGGQRSSDAKGVLAVGQTNATVAHLTSQLVTVHLCHRFGRIVDVVKLETQISMTMGIMPGNHTSTKHMGPLAFCLKQSLRKPGRCENTSRSTSSRRSCE